MKIKGKQIFKDGERVGGIAGFRDNGEWLGAGYFVLLNDGRKFGTTVTRDGIEKGVFCYFRDCAQYVKNGDLAADMEEA